MKKMTKAFCYVGTRVFLAILLGITAVATVEAVPAAGNLVKNGDFVEATGWSLEGAATIVPRPDAPQKMCAKLEPKAKLIQEVPVVAGTAYRIQFQNAGGEGWLVTLFLDAAGKEMPGAGYGEDMRGFYYFSFAAPAEKWGSSEQRLLAPKGSSRLRIRFGPQAEAPTVYVTDVRLTAEPITRIEKSKEDRLVFEEHFEGFPEMEANGARFRPGLTKVDFVPGFKGNAARFSSESGVYYSLQGIMATFDEGTIEVYAKMEWTDKPILSSRNPMQIWAAFGLGEENNTAASMDLTFRDRAIAVRVSSGGLGEATAPTPGLEGWHLLAIIWKANQGKGKDSVKLYLDGRPVANINHVPVTFHPKDPAKAGFSMGNGPMGAICLLDELKIYSVAKE